MITHFASRIHILLKVMYFQANEEDGHQSQGPEDVPEVVEADIVMTETETGVRLGELAAAKAPSPSKDIFQWSNADIIQLSDDLLYKLQQQRSREDTGGIDQEEMVRLGQLFMKRAFDIEVSRAPFLVDTDGNCLPNTLSYIGNPNQTEQMTAEGGTRLRQVVVGQVIDFVKEASMEALELIQVAAAARTEEVGMVEWLTRDELVTRLQTYKEDGTWAGDLGDVMPQLYASFTNSPIFVIVMCSNRKTMIGYYVNPSHIFNRPTLRTAASPVMLDHRHYEPLIVPQGCMEAWEAICGSHETQELAMAAIQVQLSEEDLRGLRGERRDGTGATPSTTAAEQRQQGQDDGSNLAGDCSYHLIR